MSSKKLCLCFAAGVGAATVSYEVPPEVPETAAPLDAAPIGAS